MTVALPCLCIAGPTASGKTAAALAIAAALAPTRRVEIISVDSALVYRGMNIGTAKPTPQERAQVPHHLIDLIDPSAAYSAAQFVAAATKLIDDIAARGALPLLVGGTMLYFKALFDGLDDMPAADLQIRAEIDAQAARDGWPALHAELARIDPLTAQRLAPADAQRVQRALEVFRISGKPLSAFHSAGEARASAPLIALEPADRAWLHARIGERFVAMLAAGFIDEVRALRARGDLHADLPAMRCVGYRQAWQALDRSASGEFGEPQDTPAWRELRDVGTAATRQLAKRQLTWLRSMPGRHSVACDAPDALARTVELAHELIAQLPRT